MILDNWLGKEGVEFFREKELVGILQTHVESEEAELDQVEGVGALNFLRLDDVRVVEEGELVDEASIIRLPTKVDFPLIPEITRSADNEFLKQVHASGHHWVVLANLQGEPLLLLDADGALRAALMEIDQPFDFYNYCARPLVIRDGSKTLTDVISYLKSLPSLSESEDGAINYDAVLIWNDERRIITGADILGKLLKGIPAEVPPSQSSVP